MSVHRQEEIHKTTLFSLTINVFLTLVMWITGVLGNSSALVANAIESTNDVIASIAVFLGLKYAQKPADDDHPYGHGRIEPVITFIVVLIMIVSAGIIAHNAINNFNKPRTSPKIWTLAIVSFFLIWKEVAFRIVLRKSKELKSTALRAEAWHHRSDAITDLSALVGIGLALLLGEKYVFLDDVAALVAACVIAYNAFKIFRPAWGEIMDEQTHDSFIDLILEDSKLIPEIHRIEKCHIRKVGIYLFIDMHLELDGEMTVRKGHEIAHQFKDILMSKYAEIGDVLIHIEPYNIALDEKTKL